MKECLLCGKPTGNGRICPKIHRHDYDYWMPVARRVAQELNRAEKLNLTADLTFRQWLRAMNYFIRGSAEVGWVGFICAYCGKFHDPTKFSIDHWVAITQGGGTTVLNCVPSCGNCNIMKGADTGDGFFHSLIHTLKSDGASERYQFALDYFEAIRNGTIDELKDANTDREWRVAGWIK